MATLDDIKGEPASSEGTEPPAKGPRSVGPESEARGGAEATDEPVDRPAQKPD